MDTDSLICWPGQLGEPGQGSSTGDGQKQSAKEIEWERKEGEKPNGGGHAVTH